MTTQAHHPQSKTGIILTMDGTEIGEITDFPTISSASADEIEATHFRSAAKEYLTGLTDFGTAQFEVNLVAADEGQRKCWKARADKTLHTFVITLPDATDTQLSMDGRITGFEISASQGSTVSASISIRISGEVAGFPEPTA